MCHADRSISISVPKQAINDYAMGVSNVVLQVSLFYANTIFCQMT